MIHFQQNSNNIWWENDRSNGNNKLLNQLVQNLIKTYQWSTHSVLRRCSYGFLSAMMTGQIPVELYLPEEFQFNYKFTNTNQTLTENSKFN